MVRLEPGGVVAAVVDSSPRDVALRWQAAGAPWVHLVDVDAAFGTGSNRDLLTALVGELDVSVQLSAGVRDEESLAWALSTGASRVVVQSSALVDRAWCCRVLAEHGDRLVVALDVRPGDPRERGRLVISPRGSDAALGDLRDALEFLDRAGCVGYVVTDVGRDGALSGPNLDLHRRVCDATAASVFASGGVSSLDDPRALAGLARVNRNLSGVVVGGALHAGRFSVADALEVLADAT